MFEHIYFFTHQADGENQEVLEDEAYQKMAKKHHLLRQKTQHSVLMENPVIFCSIHCPGKSKNT